MYSEEWLYGSIRKYAPATRAVWTDLQAMASKPPFCGKICISENIGYSFEQLAGLFNTPVDVFINAIDIFVFEKYISISDNKIITLLDWEKYQSEYDRLQKYKEGTEKSTKKGTEKGTEKSTALIRRRTEREGEQKEKEKNTCAKAQFVKPSIQEISDYCKERKNNIDPEAFYNFYESKGWLVGRNKMKDWRAAIRTWEKNNYIKRRPTS